MSLRILQVSAHYPPFLGGIANHVAEVSRRLVERGAEVTVLTTDPSGSLPEDDVIDGVKVRRIKSWPNREDVFFAPGIARHIVAGRWDVVHCQGSHTLVPPIAMASSIRAGIPFIVTFHTGVHSSSIRNLLRPLEWEILRPLFARATRFVGVSAYEAQYFQRHLRLDPSRVVVIPNGADLPPLPDISASATVKQTTIVSIGRLEQYKGHHRAIQALPYVLRVLPNARLILLGSGPYEATLRLLAADLGVDNQVDIRFIQPTERERLAQTLRDAALMVLFSSGESHPLAVIEAASLGCSALVAEDHMGCSELAANGYARSISLDSTAAEVGAAMIDQILHPFVPQPMALPTWDACADRLHTLYQGVTGEAVCAS